MSIRRASQDGFTLVELLVVMLLVGIVGSFVTVSLVNGMGVARSTSQRATALHDVERALQVVGRELRIADPIRLDESGDYANTISAQVERDGVIQIHTFTIEEDDGIQFLFQDVLEFEPDEIGPGGPTEDSTPISQPRRRLVTDVDNGIDAVFTYHDALGAEIDCTDTTSEQTCEQAVQIGIKLVRNLEGDEEIRAETRINVRNLRYGRIER